MTLPAFPSVSPDPEIAHNYTSDLSLTLSPISSDGYDAYSISKLYDPSPTNAWVVANRITPVNESQGYVTGSLFVMPSAELPFTGSDTYYIYAYRFAAGGGDQQYYYSSSFTITRFTAPTFPDVSPDPTISSSYTGNLLLTLSPVASDGLDAYSISRVLDTTPTNQFVTDNRISPANTFLDYVTGSSFEMPASELPAAGSQYTYYIYAYRFPSGGGEGQYYYAYDFKITRQSVPTSGYGLQVFDSSGAKRIDINSALIAIAGVDSVTIAANSSIQVSIAGLDNSGVWKVFLDGFLYSGSTPIYTSVITPSVTYSNGYYTLTNNSTAYSWIGTAFVYRVS